MIKKHTAHFLLIFIYSFTIHTEAQTNILYALDSPIIFKGNDTTAYRDPAVLFHNNIFYLFYTLVKNEEGKIYSYTAERHSVDLRNWSLEKILTTKDQSLNFCSPGNIINYKNEFYVYKPIRVLTIHWTRAIALVQRMRDCIPCVAKTSIIGVNLK